MKKVIINYDEATGSVHDTNGTFIFTYPGLIAEDAAKDGKDSTEELVKLKNAGFTCDEIIALKKHDLI